MHPWPLCAALIVRPRKNLRPSRRVSNLGGAVRGGGEQRAATRPHVGLGPLALVRPAATRRVAESRVGKGRNERTVHTWSCSIESRTMTTASTSSDPSLLVLAGPRHVLSTSGPTTSSEAGPSSSNTSTTKRFLLLPHPRTGLPTYFLPACSASQGGDGIANLADCDEIYELQAVRNEKHSRSWFLNGGDDQGDDVTGRGWVMQGESFRRTALVYLMCLSDFESPSSFRWNPARPLPHRPHLPPLGHLPTRK